MISEGYPVSELAVMDTVLRCATQPLFVLDQDLLHQHLHDVQQSKVDLLARCGLASKDELMSNDKFANALENLGVDPPRKISLTTGLETWAFAKTDQDFMDLEEHEDPEVQALVSARIGVKSTLEETRTERLISISNLTWGSNLRLLPMPLRYSAAHTHRLGGDWKLNMQNLPSRTNNKIRSAIKAPDGYTVVAVDASQIEARMAAWFCGATNLVKQFADGEDVYSTFAAVVFGYEVDKSKKSERFIGKTAMLGLQYGLGFFKFMKTVALQSVAQVGILISLSDEEASRVVNAYRKTYDAIPKMWKTLNHMITRMASEPQLSHTIGPVTFEYGRIRLPSGLFLYFHELEQKAGEWWFTYGGKPKKLYGGKLLENIIQALARIHVMDAAVRARKRLAALGIYLNLQVHDELIYVVLDEHVEITRQVVLEEMCRTPVWGMDIPLKAEAAVGKSFGDAK